MKRLAIGSLFLLLGISTVLAQNFRIEVGAKVHRLDKFSEVIEVPTREIPIILSLGLEVPVSKELYLETELTFAKKNLELSLLNSQKTLLPTLKGIKKLNPRYYSTSTKIPLNIGYRKKLGQNLAFNIEAGAYFIFELDSEIGYQGKEKIKVSKIKTDLKEDFIDEQEYGINLSTALEYSKVYLRLGAEYNLTKRFDLDQAFKQNIKLARKLFDDINEDKLFYYLTLGIHL